MEIGEKMNKTYNVEEIYRIQDKDDLSEDLSLFLINNGDDKMELDNSMQGKFLMDIKDIGMKIVFKECTEQLVYDTFRPYVEYMNNEDAIPYLEQLKQILNNLNTTTPDDILMNLGYFTKKIEYDDEEEEE